MTDRTRGVEQNGEAGFTLVEMLVALALFSVLVTVLFGNVQFGLKAWNKTSASTEQLDRAVMVQDVLRRIVGSLYPMADFRKRRAAIGGFQRQPRRHELSRQRASGHGRRRPVSL